MAKLPAELCTLTIIGNLTADKDYVREIRRQIDVCKLSARVTIPGALPDEELVARLRSAQVLAVPSSYEGFGIVYLEGMGFGLPAIGTLAGGAREIISHGENGFLIAEGDILALAECLRNIAYDRDWLSLMGKNAHERYLFHSTWQQSCRNITSFLERVKSQMKTKISS